MALFQISEYGCIKSLDEVSRPTKDSVICIPGNSFNNLWDFILEKQGSDESPDKAFDLYTKGGKRIIRAKNYVGVIETKSKDIIEVLPKIYGVESNFEAKRIFLKMLRVLNNFNNISFQEAGINSKDDFPIFELFITNYIVEAEKLVLQGLKKGYVKTESNHPFLKGKLIFKHHIKQNLIDKSKFYVSYSSYNPNIGLNRIIKTTLSKLLSLTKSNSNKNKIRRLRDFLTDVPQSENIPLDLTSVQNLSRQYSDYSKLIQWSEIFLLNKGFTNFSGTNINQAMLFPMEKVFESFVSYQIKRYSKDYSITTQHKKFHLIEKFRTRPKYRLRPDIVATNKEGNGCIILDTKWKILKDNKNGKLIQQSDLYQMYAYGRKYLKGLGEPVLYLIYPMNQEFSKELSPFYYEKEGDFWLKLFAYPFDLRGNYESQVSQLLNYYPNDSESITLEFESTRSTSN